VPDGPRGASPLCELVGKAIPLGAT
jgi:hypothetical protein